MLTSCLHANDKGSVGMYECYGKYSNFLLAQQKTTLSEIRKSLNNNGPSGTDYKAALSKLDSSQKDWEAYINNDCQLRENVFGEGNAAALDSLDCLIEHYEIRNKHLKFLREQFFH